MKRLFQTLFGLMLSVALFSACEGPAGAKGDKGDTGATGKDATVKCTQCHGDADVNLKFAQYELSTHNKGIIYDEEAGRLDCGGCHTGDGFAEIVAAGPNAVTPVKNATSKINCQTCHTIHTAYDSTDFALRATAPVVLRIGGATVDFKTGNACARCHQGRTYVSVVGADTTFKTTGSTTYTRYGPHYGTPANVFSMNGLYNITGSNAIPTANKHANLSKGCVTCHMGSLSTNPAAGGHTFLMAPTTFTEMATNGECKTCHTAADFAATALPVTKAVTAALKETRDSLISKKFLDISQTANADGTYNSLGEYIAQSKTGNYMTKEQVQVTLNYLYLAKDRSFGAHNPTYVKALVLNGLEVLKK